MTYIPYGRQSIDQNDVQAVIAVLQSDWITQGPSIEKFEHAVAEYCGVKYAVAVNSATSALHIACIVAGLEKGDYLWTSPNTFVASANCGLYCGAKVDFVDIDKKTYNLSLEKLAEKLACASQNGMLPKVVMPVHFSGQSCEMDELFKLAQQYNFKVIEDASHAIGGSYQNKKVGCCQYSDMTVFSFHPVKIITTAEGGMVTTNDEALYEKLLCLRSHGITRNPEYMQGEPDGPWYYQQIELGYNYRMTDLQAALGLSQLQRVDTFIKRRIELAKKYTEALKDLPIILPYQRQKLQSAWHLYVIQIISEQCKKSRRQIFEELRERGIGVNVHYIPVHTQPYYLQQGFKPGDYPNAEQYYRQAVSIPLYYGLSDVEQEKVIEALIEVVK